MTMFVERTYSEVRRLLLKTQIKETMETFKTKNSKKDE